MPLGVRVMDVMTIYSIYGSYRVDTTYAFVDLVRK